MINKKQRKTSNSTSNKSKSSYDTARRRRSTRRRKRRRKKLFRYVLVELIVIIILLAALEMKFNISSSVSDWITQLRNPAVSELDITGINSSYAVLMQAENGTIIGDINGEEQMYPASMTKIMTAIVAIENLSDLNQEITITNDMVADLYAQDAMQAGFEVGESVKAIDLLYGVMLPSGAECCRALAYTISGSESAFVELMNEKVEKLGLTGTHFCDTTGLHDPNHYSTAKDIALILRYAIKNTTFREIIETKTYTSSSTNVHPDGITFSSTLLKNLSDPSVTDGTILGGKTGYTNAAGHCLASFAEIDGIEYILVTAGAQGTDRPHISDAVTIYNRLGEASAALRQK